MREALVQPHPAESYGFKDILYTKKDGVATITFNRPQVYNSYSTLGLTEIKKALFDVECDDSIAVMVLTGAGDKAFCTGGDINEYQGNYVRTPRDFVKWCRLWYDAYSALMKCNKVTIARINGMAIGGGNEWQAACDLAIAADHAKFGQVGTKVGSMAATACTLLPIMIGDRRAREVLFLCRQYSAKQALEWGLVNQVVPYAELDAAVASMCEELKNKFTDCTRGTKINLNVWKDFAMVQNYQAFDWLTLHFNTMETHEGMHSFTEKRQPDYAGLRKRAAEGKSVEYMWGPNVIECKSCKTRFLPEDGKFCMNCGAKL
ncbi:MAG: enoyl-CoA hydratase/isomerase family protein [Syntrophobacteraceae bacterium]